MCRPRPKQSSRQTICTRNFQAYTKLYPYFFERETIFISREKFWKLRVKSVTINKKKLCVMQNNFLFACAVDKCEWWRKWVITTARRNFYDTNFVIEFRKRFFPVNFAAFLSSSISPWKFYLDKVRRLEKKS